MVGFLEGPDEIRQRIACRHGFNDDFIRERGADVAIDAFDVQVPGHIVCCREGDALLLHRMKLAEFLFMEMAGRTKSIVPLQRISHDHSRPKHGDAEQGQACEHIEPALPETHQALSDVDGIYCTRTRATLENFTRPDGAVFPPAGSTYLPVFSSSASPVPYRNAAVIVYSPGVCGA